MDWSRDGRWVLYHEITPGTQRDLWVLPSTPEGKPAPDATPRPYLRTPFNERWGRFSPEDSPRWVAYQSDETGRWEVYIQAFPEPRGATQISTGGGQYPQWGAGARELFYVSLDNKLMVVSLKMGADTVEPSTPRELFPLPAVDTGYSPYDTTPRWPALPGARHAGAWSRAAADGHRQLAGAVEGREKVNEEQGDSPVILTNGARLGPYEILAPIGAGGMGEVYRARRSYRDKKSPRTG